MAQLEPDPTISAERMRSLLERWQQSLELHTRYLQLDDAHYWLVQPWPQHERPAAWIVRLARQKVAELARSLAEHSARGELQFAVGLEHMAFLANLVGLQPAGRHLPLADPQNEQTEIMPVLRSPSRKTAKALRATRTTPAAASPSRTPQSPTPPSQPPPLQPAIRQVVEDAVRLLQWGRKWHELGELISRLPERPSVGDSRRMLREHRTQIEATVSSTSPNE